MTFDRTHFGKLSIPVQGLILLALPFPLFILFAIAGDLPRGTLVWAFSTALLNALYACGEKRILRSMGPSTAILVAFHISIVVWNPLRQVHLLGGLFVPIAVGDYCIDYALLWLTSKSGRAVGP